jgi:DNA-binding SARP family transcriptional activator/DNA-binding CsgD family transcriptional regulator
MRVLSVEQVATGLDDAFRLLVGGVRGGPARHQTLRATLDWSYELLSEPERVAFRRLAVFPGGFDLEAAERVAVAGGGIAEHEVLDLLTCLVDKSLVSVRRTPASARYRMLSTVRDYGRQQLIAAGEQRATGRAHLEYFCRFAEHWEPRLAGPDQTRALDRLEAEANNLRLALTFAKESGDVRPGMRLIAALWRLCCLRGHYREGREWLDWAATADPSGPPELRAKLWRGSGSLAFLQCDYPTALHRLEEALELYRQLGDRTGVATVLQVLGSVAREQGRYADAESLHGESLALFDSAGDCLGVAQAHGYLGFVSWLQGHWAAAVEHCRRALREFRTLDDAEGIAWSLISLGTVAQYQGDGGMAARLLDDAHDLAVRINYPEGIAWSLHERGLLALQREEPGAEQLLGEALARHRTLGDRWRTASVLLDVAAASLRRGDAGQAAELLGAAGRIRDEIGTVIAPCERPAHDAVVAAATTALGDEAFAVLWNRGREERLDDLLVPRPADNSSAVPEVPRPEAPPPRPRVTEAPPLRIRMLGATTVELGSRTLTAADWAYGKPRELLLLLASSPGQSKARIGAALWPDLAGPRLRNALHTALRDLRRALGDPGWVVYSDGIYTLDRLREHWSDVEAFDGCLADARRAQCPEDALTSLQGAIALYRGDFVPELDGAAWVTQRRAELRRAFSTALAGAGQLLAGAGRCAEAVEVYRTAAAHAPLSEAPHRELITCLARSGEPGLAVQVYRDLARRLREELGVSPAAETTALVQRIAGGCAAGVAGVRGEVPGSASPAAPVPTPRSVERIRDGVREPQRSTRLGSLSPREREVLREMAQGRTNAAIAGALVITQKAVEKHINSIFAKLGVSFDDELHPRVGAVLSFLADTGATPGSPLEP